MGRRIERLLGKRGQGNSKARLLADEEVRDMSEDNDTADDEEDDDE